MGGPKLGQKHVLEHTTAIIVLAHQAAAYSSTLPANVLAPAIIF